MTAQLPLGRPETDVLEFKSRDVLARESGTDNVGRAVVAFLNHRGGEVWIGLGETHSTATSIEPIDEVEKERDSLWDRLIDTIEPRPTSDEVALQPVDTPAGKILRIIVKPLEANRPYALLQRGGGRYFYKRTERRTVLMSREELMKSYIESQGVGPASSPAEQWLSRERAKVVESHEPVFWIGAVPLEPQSLDIVGQEGLLRELLTDPARSSNRWPGWTVVHRYLSFGVREDHVFAVDKSGTWRVHVARDGNLFFQAPLDRLHHQGDRRELWPWALLEFPVSFLRVQAAVLAELAPDAGGGVLVDAVMTGLEGWILKPGSPRSRVYEKPFPGSPHSGPYASDIVSFEAPLRFRVADVRNDPDRCALRLIRRIYEAFGYGQDMIPAEFDQTTGRLDLE